MGGCIAAHVLAKSRPGGILAEASGHMPAWNGGSALYIPVRANVQAGVVAFRWNAQGAIARQGMSP